MEEARMKNNFKLVAIGGSAGSLEVILKMLEDLRNDRLAIIIVLHRKGSVYSTLADLLNLRTVIKVKEAEEKEFIEPGTVYVAPADYHLLIENNRSLSLDYSEKVNFSRPSIDVTFECAASVFGKNAIGVLLSGGNADGVEGLKAIKKAGGYCVVQDPDTALVSFMPQYALNEIEVDKKLQGDELAGFLESLH
jgi:two-component system, chemotaxis family, protein-glutamate methylesterase/glutaminase